MLLRVSHSAPSPLTLRGVCLNLHQHRLIYLDILAVQLYLTPVHTRIQRYSLSYFSRPFTDWQLRLCSMKPRDQHQNQGIKSPPVPAPLFSRSRCLGRNGCATSSLDRCSHSMLDLDHLWLAIAARYLGATCQEHQDHARQLWLMQKSFTASASTCRQFHAHQPAHEAAHLFWYPPACSSLS